MPSGQWVVMLHAVTAASLMNLAIGLWAVAGRSSGRLNSYRDAALQASKQGIVSRANRVRLIRRGSVPGLH
jgi:hypothetical protein